MTIFPAFSVLPLVSPVPPFPALSILPAFSVLSEKISSIASLYFRYRKDTGLAKD